MCMGINMDKQKKESGFALLMTLIVVGAVLSIGLSVLDLTIKQVVLSTNAKESEIAFHAANAGMECAQYWRKGSSTAMETGSVISPSCFGVNSSPSSISPSTVLSTVDGQVFQYQYDFTWGSAGSFRCTHVNAIVASTTITGAGVTISNMTTLVPGYPDGDTKYCEPGARCTVISVLGYNRPCNTITGYGVVQREVLLQY